MDKKEKRGIFVVTTRNAAKKRINKEFQNVINKREKREGRKLTKEEKKELRTEFHERRGKRAVIRNSESTSADSSKESETR